MVCHWLPSPFKRPPASLACRSIMASYAEYSLLFFPVCEGGDCRPMQLHFIHATLFSILSSLGTSNEGLHLHLVELGQECFWARSQSPGWDPAETQYGWLSWRVNRLILNSLFHFRVLFAVQIAAQNPKNPFSHMSFAHGGGVSPECRIFRTENHSTPRLNQPTLDLRFC